MAPPILTVSQLTQAIKLCLESAFPIISLQGEISNFKAQSSGHLYFCLKDQYAQVQAVMFRGDALRLRKMPKDGDHVIVKGELNVYPPRGNYQFIVKELSFAGIGELLLKLEELKQKLQAKGWFDPQHKQKLPKFPKRIGVVTSPTGAVIQDILHILNRRHAGFKLILNPVKVQGEGAAREIAAAIDQFNHYQLADVLIVGRGGGSLEDLWAFNEEVVADAIFRSKIPIISAVGHEIDYSIADFVADVRAPTPSAAAEIVIAEKAQQFQFLEQIQTRLTQTFFHLYRQDKHKLLMLTRHPLLQNPLKILGPWMQKIDEIRNQIDQSLAQILKNNKLQIDLYTKQLERLKPLNQMLYLRERLERLEKNLTFSLNKYLAHSQNELLTKNQQLNQNTRNIITNYKKQYNYNALTRRLLQLWNSLFYLKKERLDKLVITIRAIDPKRLLDKGYSILFSEDDGEVISSIAALKPGSKGRLLLSDGEASLTINRVDKRG